MSFGGENSVLKFVEFWTPETAVKNAQNLLRLSIEMPFKMGENEGPKIDPTFGTFEGQNSARF